VVSRYLSFLSLKINKLKKDDGDVGKNIKNGHAPKMGHLTDSSPETFGVDYTLLYCHAAKANLLSTSATFVYKKCGSHRPYPLELGACLPNINLIPARFQPSNILFSFSLNSALKRWRCLNLIPRARLFVQLKSFLYAVSVNERGSSSSSKNFISPKRQFYFKGKAPIKTNP